MTAPRTRTGFITREVVVNLYPLLVDKRFIGPMGFLSLCAFIEACVLNDIVEFDALEVTGVPAGMKERINVLGAVANSQTFERLGAAGVLKGIDFERSMASVEHRVEAYAGKLVTLSEFFDKLYGNRDVSYLSGFTPSADIDCTAKYLALHLDTTDAFNRVDLTPGLSADRLSGCNPDITPETFPEYPLMEKVGLDFLYTMNGRISDFVCVGLAGDLADRHIHVSPLETPHFLMRGRAVNDLSEWVYKRMSEKALASLQELGIRSILPAVPPIAPVAISRCKGNLANLADVLLELRDQLEPVRRFTRTIDDLHLAPQNAQELLSLNRELDQAWLALPGHNAPREKALRYGSWWFSQLVAACVSPSFVLEGIANRIIDTISTRLGKLPQRPMNKVVTSFAETFALLERDFDLRHELPKMAAELAPNENWRSMMQLVRLNSTITETVTPLTPARVE